MDFFSKLFKKTETNTNTPNDKLEDNWEKVDDDWESYDPKQFENTTETKNNNYKNIEEDDGFEKYDPSLFENNTSKNNYKPNNNTYNSTYNNNKPNYNNNNDRSQYQYNYNNNNNNKTREEKRISENIQNLNAAKKLLEMMNNDRNDVRNKWANTYQSSLKISDSIPISVINQSLVEAESEEKKFVEFKQNYSATNSKFISDNPSLKYGNKSIKNFLFKNFL
jgi:hypothetical protein